MRNAAKNLLLAMDPVHVVDDHLSTFLLSDLAFIKGSGDMLSKLLRLGDHGVKQTLIIPRRWSGHNAMTIKPSNLEMKIAHNWLHFYFIITAVPIFIITSIINIRANPELSEIPEGYEPQHWEYYKHPVTRFLARYLYEANDTDQSVLLAYQQDLAHDSITRTIRKKCEDVMSFYNDHRSFYFQPYYGEYFRHGRDEAGFKFMFEKTELNRILDIAYDPKSRVVPTEGYPSNYDPEDTK